MLREASYIILHADNSIIEGQASLSIDDVMVEIREYIDIAMRSTGQEPNYIYIGIDIMRRLCGESVSGYMADSVNKTIMGMGFEVLPYLKGALPVRK